MDGPWFFRGPLLGDSGHQTSLYPDVFSIRAGQVEDVVSEVTVREGFKDRPSVQNESFSARDLVWHRLRGERKLRDLEELAEDVYTARRQKRKVCPVPRTVGADSKNAPISRFPTRITLTEEQSKAWIQDLADLQIPLTKLARAVPQRLKGSRLLEEITTNRVDLSRSIWLIKLVGAAEIRSNSDETRDGYTKTWTTIVFDAMTSAMTSAFDDASFRYLTGLVAAMQQEELLDLVHLAFLFQAAHHRRHFETVLQNRLALIIAVLTRSKELENLSLLTGKESDHNWALLSPQLTSVMEAQPTRLQTKTVGYLKSRMTPQIFWRHFDDTQAAIVIPAIFTWATSLASQRDECRPYRAAKVLSHVIRMKLIQTTVVDWLMGICASVDTSSIDISLVGIVISEVAKVGFAVGSYLWRVVAKGIRNPYFMVHCKLLGRLDLADDTEIANFLAYHRPTVRQEVKSAMEELVNTWLDDDSSTTSTAINSISTHLEIGDVSWKECLSLGKQLLSYSDISAMKKQTLLRFVHTLCALYLFELAGRILVESLSAMASFEILDDICQALSDRREIFEHVGLAQHVADGLFVRLEHFQSVGVVHPGLLATYASYECHLSETTKGKGRSKIEDLQKRLRAPNRRLAARGSYPEIQKLRVSGTIDEWRDAAQKTWLHHSSDTNWLFIALGNLFSWMRHQQTVCAEENDEQILDVAMAFIEVLNRYSIQGITYAFVLALDQRLKSCPTFYDIASVLISQLKPVFILEELLKALSWSSSQYVRLWNGTLEYLLLGRICDRNLLSNLCKWALTIDDEDALDLLLELIFVRAEANPSIVIEFVNSDSQNTNGAFREKLGLYIDGCNLDSEKGPCDVDCQSQLALFDLRRNRFSQIDAMRLLESAGLYFDRMITGWPSEQSETMLRYLGQALILSMFSKDTDITLAQRAVHAKTFETLVRQCGTSFETSSLEDLHITIFEILQDLVSRWEASSDDLFGDAESDENGSRMETPVDIFHQDEIAALVFKLVAKVATASQSAQVIHAILRYLSYLHEWKYTTVTRSCVQAIEDLQHRHGPFVPDATSPRFESNDYSGGDSRMISQLKRLLPYNFADLGHTRPNERAWGIIQTSEGNCREDPDLSSCHGPSCLLAFNATLLDQVGRYKLDIRATPFGAAGEADSTDGWRSLVERNRQRQGRGVTSPLICSR